MEVSVVGTQWVGGGGGNGRNEASKVSKTRPYWALTWVMVRNVDLGI